MNELIFLFLSIIIISSVVLVTKSKKSEYSTYLSLILLIPSYLLSFKNIKILGTSIIANSITYASYIALINQYYLQFNKKATRKLLEQNILILVITTLTLIILTSYIPSVNSTLSINVYNLFKENCRLLIIFPILTIASQYLSLMFYERLSNWYKDNFITLVFTNLVIGIIDIFFFTIISYLGILTSINLFSLLLSTYLTRLILIIIYGIIFQIKKVKK